MVAYGKPTEMNTTVDLNSEWVSDTTDNEYRYFKSNSIEFEPPFSQCKVTWSNLTSVTFKYMSSSSSDIGNLFVSKLDGEKFTLQTNPDEDVYQSTIDKTPGTYNEFTIECDESEHHIWFAYVKNESATDEDRGFIGVPKSARTVLDVKQGAELPTEYKYGGVSAENGKTYDINFKNVILPNGSNIGPFYDDFEKTEKTITYEYVDLGLPSRLKWATCNIGASSETDYGVFFQWGETSGVSGSLVGKYSDENYSWATYKHGKGSYNTPTKYNTNGKSTLDTEDDAARAIMGDEWRMPTKNECQELIDETTNEWTQVNGVNGYKFTSKTDESKYIFIPAAGNYINGSVYNVDSGYVWSSSFDPDSYYHDAWRLDFNQYGINMFLDYDGRGWSRSDGQVVRGVRN